MATKRQEKALKTTAKNGGNIYRRIASKLLGQSKCDTTSQSIIVLEAKVNKQQKDFEKIVAELNSELTYWKRVFKTYSRIACGHCGKQMHVYPYGGAYYTTHDGKKVHAGCYDAYLNLGKANNEKTN